MPAKSVRRFLTALLALGALAAGSSQSFAYSLTGTHWFTRTITMQLQLGASSGTLLDGSTSWNASAEDALMTWNQYIAGTQFTVVRDSSALIGQGNNTNNVFFSRDIYGDAWGTGVLAVTLTYATNSGQNTETDVLFNNNLSWDSYRGSQRYNSSGGVYDFHRVAMHEFGHVLGLDHPDQNGQSVSALMNSHISNLDTLTSDDITGAQSIYGAATGTVTATAPVITTQPVSQTVTAGANVTFSVAASGTAPFAYQWKKDGAALSGATSASLTLASVTSSSSGLYTVDVSNSAGSVTSSAASLTVNTPAPGAVAPAFTTQPASRAVTVGAAASFTVSASGSPAPTYQWYKDGGAIAGATSSTYSIASVGTGDAGSYYARATNSAGSATSNTATLTVNAVTVAPTITTQPVAQTVSRGDTIALRVTATGTPSPTYQWKKNGVSISGATQSQLLIGSAKLSDAGSYSVVITNSAGSITTTPVTVTVLHSELGNLSTRGYLPTGSNALIIGFALRGPTSKPLVSRAVGPGLKDYGVTDYMTDPNLQVVLQTDTSRVYASNSGWTQQLASSFGAVGAFPLAAGSADAAAQVNLSAGNYTTLVRSDTGSGGVTLGEIYDADSSNTETRLINLSALGYTSTGEKALVAGFSVQGTKPKQLLIRAIGPTLSQYYVASPLANPKLAVYPLGSDTKIAENDDWSGTSELKAAFSSAGAFSLPGASRDAAVVVTVDPGSYTIVVTSADGSTGNALVEIYDLDP